ncbi:MAG: hypothetical protein HYU99_06435 [Deltaproteobacteria bacterium]|nr:hypothetical protein [Deltaproteobacteria bacterium]
MADPQNLFQKYMKFEGEIKGKELTRGDVKRIGENFISALVKSFDEYLADSKKRQVANPAMAAIQNTVTDIANYSQQLMSKYKDVFKS